MKMKTLSKTLMVLTTVLAVASAKAQSVSPVDFMRLNPYQINSNPAVDLPYYSYGMFAIANFDVSITSNSLRYKNMFEFDAQGCPEFINFVKLSNSLKDHNDLAYNLKENILSAGFRLDVGFLSVSYDLRSQGVMTFDKNLFNLMANGLSDYVGESHPFSTKMNMKMQAYQEFSVGDQLNVTKQLSLGARAKLLFGAANVNMNDLSLKIVSNPDNYAIRIYENIDTYVNLPSPLRFEEGVFMTNGYFKLGTLFSNPGFGIDLAVDYQINDDFNLVAAVHDLGFIRWKGNAQHLFGNINDAGQFYDDGSFFFSGLDIDELQRIVSDKYYRELFMDTIKDYFRFDSENVAGYTTMLNTNILLRGSYDITAQSRVSAQLQGYFRGDSFCPAMTLAYNGSFNNMFDICATYTAMKSSFTNFGIGVAGNFAPFHIYLATNDIIGLVSPMNAGGFNAQFGIVFNFREQNNGVGTYTPKYMR